MHVQVHVMLINNLFHTKKNLSQRFLRLHVFKWKTELLYLLHWLHTWWRQSWFFYEMLSTHFYHFFDGTWCFFPAFKNGFIHICGSWLYMINLGIVTIVIMAMLKCLQTLVLWQCVLGHYTVLLMFSKA